MRSELFTGPELAELRVRLGKSGLAQPFGWVPFSAADSLPSNVSTSPVTLYSATIYRALSLKTWYQAAYVATTNDGSNYWTIALVEADLTAITSVNTSAASADTWTMLSDTSVGGSVDRGDIGLLVRVTKTGSPGNLYLMAPALFAV